MTTIHLIRHGETEWSLSGRHTGRTEVPLTPHGEAQARALRGALSGLSFAHVLVSPRLRARRTCELAGLGGLAMEEPDLAEWDYGDYEGLTSAEIHRARPGWSVMADGCPGGEAPAEIETRVARLLGRLRGLEGDVALFAHGHIGRALAAGWIGMALPVAARLALDPASIGVLRMEHGRPVIGLWNARRL